MCFYNIKLLVLQKEEEKESIKFLQKRAIAGIELGTFWSEGYTFTPCTNRTIEMTFHSFSDTSYLWSQ